MGLPFCSPRAYGEDAGGAINTSPRPRARTQQAPTSLQPDEERSHGIVDVTRRADGTAIDLVR
jgi:hypothetical protein